MDLSDGPEEQALRAGLRDFIARHRHRAPSGFNPARNAPEVRDWQALLIEHGYAARDIPRAYGGFGAAPDLLAARIIAEEFTAAGVPMGLSGQGIAMLTPTLLQFGTEAQKQRWIPPSWHGCICGHRGAFRTGPTRRHSRISAMPRWRCSPRPTASSPMRRPMPRCCGATTCYPISAVPPTTPPSWRSASPRNRRWYGAWGFSKAEPPSRQHAGRHRDRLANRGSRT
ncbi:acyl-CoA dehydrogenase family protein [Humitalea rosea]|uniref:acyl-CoA dehydrogenase family protein n=1 Tax=Humitalea rosea TaxID=990373 RepID=UPI000DAF0C40|nr:acyl-CoA dehydrogenase family protein [Humitalea rosea]